MKVFCGEKKNELRQKVFFKASAKILQVELDYLNTL
jgi:hypothetical protein